MNQFENSVQLTARPNIKSAMLATVVQRHLLKNVFYLRENMQNRSIYLEKMTRQLDELNVQLSELEYAATTAKVEALDRYQLEMAKVREQSNLMQEKLIQLKATGEESWKNMVEETEKIRDAFVNSFHYFKSQL